MENLQHSRAPIAGCPVDALSFAESVAILDRCIQKREPALVVFVNAAKVVHFQEDAQLNAAMRSASLLLADGIPVIWASRLLGRPLPERVAGIDLAEAMIELCSRREYRVFFLGARSEVLALALTELQRRHPALIVAGSHDGYFKPENEADLISEINESRADLLLLGLGTPQKELWAARNRPFLNVPVVQCAGGSFDVMAGITRRAPHWMQVNGLEWSYRLFQEPRRMWRRYLHTNPRFVWLVLKDLMGQRVGSVKRQVSSE